METLINCLSPDTPMDLEHGTGKKRRDTGGIMRLFAEAMRQIGGVYDDRVMNHRFLSCRSNNNPAGASDSTSAGFWG